MKKNKFLELQNNFSVYLLSLLFITVRLLNSYTLTIFITDMIEELIMTEESARENRSKMRIATIAVILIIVAIGFYLLYIYIVNNSNNSALMQLNSQIDVYGANVRYLLNNSALYNQVFPNSKNYQILLNLSSPFNSIGSILNINGTNVYKPAHYNWGSYNPAISTNVTNNLTALGLISPLNKDKSLKNADALRSIYALALTREDELIAMQLDSMLFNDNLFSNNNSVSKSRTISIFECGWISMTETVEATGIGTINTGCSNNYTMPLVAFPLGSMSLLAELNGKLNTIVRNQTTVNGTKSTMLYQLLYMISLTQYEGYQSYEVLYNTTIPPSLDQVIYTNNVILVNLGNLNLISTSNIILEINGTEVGYKRYFNWLVANASLSIGKHEIDVNLSNNTLYTDINVYPYISIYQSMSTGGVNQNGTSIPAKLKVTLNNYAYNSMEISVIYGPFFEFGPDITNETINTNSLVLARNNSLTVNYTVPDGCIIGEKYIDGLEFNTSHGPAVYWIAGMCS